MTQIPTLRPRVEHCVRAGWGPVSDRVENVKNGSARRRWWGARRERRRRARGKAGVSSRWDERGVEEELSVGAVLRERSSRYVHIRATPPNCSPLLPLFAASGTASMTTIPFPNVSVTTVPKSDVFCSSCSDITCGNTSHQRQFPRRVFSSHFPVWPQICYRERNTHINNLSSRCEVKQFDSLWSDYLKAAYKCRCVNRTQNTDTQQEKVTNKINIRGRIHLLDKHLYLHILTHNHTPTYIHK